MAIELSFDNTVMFEIENGYLKIVENEDGDESIIAENAHITAQGIAIDVDIDTIEHLILGKRTDVDIYKNLDTWIATIWVKPEEFATLPLGFFIFGE